MSIFDLEVSNSKSYRYQTYFYATVPYIMHFTNRGCFHNLSDGISKFSLLCVVWGGSSLRIYNS